jgi:AbrB family looped-hinge helix DNA binding protein
MKTTISTRGQVSIPAALRKKYGIEADTQVEWIEDGNAIKIVPLPKDPVKAFRGAGRNRYTSDKLIRDRRKERSEESSRDRNS